MTLNDLFSGGGAVGVLLVALTLIEIAPIKINPWSKIGKAIGKCVNGDVIEKLDETRKTLDDHIRTDDARNADMHRAAILRFNNELLRDIPHTREEFIEAFTGNTHYTSAAAASGKACKPGPAKVTMISKGAKHPYHLIKQAGGGSTVYGWVNAADVQSETDAAIDKLAGLGVINSPDYWKNAVAGGKVAYLDILFTQAAAKITKAGPRTADVKSGVGALVKAGVINTPEYWLQNYGKLQSLDLLLCALGGAV